jgi:excisionase family DNA binding protein
MGGQPPGARSGTVTRTQPNLAPPSGFRWGRPFARRTDGTPLTGIVDGRGHAVPITPDDLNGAKTLQELAEMLGRSYRTVQRMVAAGEIDSIRVGSGRGGRVLITQAALTDYLNRHHHKAIHNRPAKNRRGGSHHPGDSVNSTINPEGTLAS